MFASEKSNSTMGVPSDVVGTGVGSGVGVGTGVGVVLGAGVESIGGAVKFRFGFTIPGVDVGTGVGVELIGGAVKFRCGFSMGVVDSASAVSVPPSETKPQPPSKRTLRRSAML